jgi:hypothetical protein
MGKLGSLNPIPSCVFLANCCIWLLYGAAIGDHFIFCAVRFATQCGEFILG